MPLRVKKLVPDAQFPVRAHEGDVGYDIFASETTAIRPKERVLVSTGISIVIPEGHYGRIAPRSSLSVAGLDVGAGVIDPSYRGEVKVLLINNTYPRNPYKVRKGDKIAQLILEKVSTISVVEIESLPETDRGDGGFGSTGK